MMRDKIAYANPSALVSTNWVNQHLDDADVRLLEVDVDTTACERGHIRGAVAIDWATPTRRSNSARHPDSIGVRGDHARLRSIEIDKGGYVRRQ
jgi:3-mercaptopyruvate sulfurtransferase SseA